MAYPFGSPNSYGSSRSASRVLLVAINGDLLPSIFYHSNPLHRMRVTLVPNDASEAQTSDPLPGMFRRTLPPLPRALASPQQQYARLVHGEILRDSEGRFYEKIGATIRSVERLFSGPRGEILELRTADENDPAETILHAEARPASEHAADSAPNDMESQDEKRQTKSHPGLHESQPVDEPKPANPKPAPYRQLFAEPGLRRVVRLGDFKSMLTPQLAHPERLRDAHRLPCYLQIYETTRTERLDSLASLALGDASLVNQLAFMTEPVVRLLGLNGLPRTRPRIPPNFRRQPGVILPNERFFRLRLAHDPTAIDAAAPDQPADPPVTPAMTPRAEQTPSRAAGSTLKNSIPDHFIKPWEFKITREEALYDMNVGVTFAGLFASLAKRLTRWIGIRRELKKWKAMLTGKTLDDQLWAVRPPRRGVSHRAIREWARRTLEAAGYESKTMLLEWEIFWRRKEG